MTLKYKNNNPKPRGSHWDGGDNSRQGQNGVNFGTLFRIPNCNYLTKIVYSIILQKKNT